MSTATVMNTQIDKLFMADISRSHDKVQSLKTFPNGMMMNEYSRYRLFITLYQHLAVSLNRSQIDDTFTNIHP